SFSPRPGLRTVHTLFGGFILGYDIDQNGDEGILAEALTLADGKHTVAVETFDQVSGKILKVVVQEHDSKNDYLALGVVGDGVGLVEFEHVTNLFVDQRLYFTLNPLSAEQLVNNWMPPLGTNDIIQSVTQSQGIP